MPAYIDDAPHSGRVFDKHCGVVLDGGLVHRIGQLRRDGERVAEEEIQDVDAMRGDVVEGPAPAWSGSSSQFRAPPWAVNQPWQLISASTGRPIAPAASRARARCNLGYIRR